MMNLPGKLAELQPVPAAAFERALHSVLPFTDARLLERCKVQLQAAQRRQVCQPPGDCSTYERNVLALADQFAVAVDGIGEELLAKLVDHAGAAAVSALVNALYLVDMTLRLELVVPVVLGTAVGRHVAPAAGDDNLSVTGSISGNIIGEAIADFAAAAVLATDVDPITSELVRLRCAQTHHCRLCGSLRQRTALDAGFDETMADRVARYETAGFANAQVMALRLCDVLIMQPADATDVLRADLARYFSPTQIAEICFDVVKWSQQKALVAMQADAPPWEGVHILDFDPRGHPVFSGPV